MIRAGQPTPTVTPTGGVAGKCTRRWVRIYTATLPTDVRDARRAEIDSDIWEHVSEAEAGRRRPLATQIAILGRMVIGTPADITWRQQARRTMREHRSMKQRRLGWIALVCVTVSLTIFFGTNLLLDGSEGETTSGGQDIRWILAIPIGVLLVGTIGLVATGLWIRERRSATGISSSA